MLYRSHLLSATIFCFIPNAQIISGEIKIKDLKLATPYPAYYCHLGDKQHIISIQSHNKDSKLPCSVVYQKANKELTTLITAQRNEQTCHNKAKFMQVRLLDRGWSCTFKDKEHMKDQ